MTSSNGNIFRVTGYLCGEVTGPPWIPLTKASDTELWCFLWCFRNKGLSKYSWSWWFETLSRPLWRHWHVLHFSATTVTSIETNILASWSIPEILCQRYGLNWPSHGTAVYCIRLSIGLTFHGVRHKLSLRAISLISVLFNLDSLVQKQDDVMPWAHFPHLLWWRHNERNGASNHRRLDCLLNRLFRRRSKKGQ